MNIQHVKQEYVGEPINAMATLLPASQCLKRNAFGTKVSAQHDHQLMFANNLEFTYVRSELDVGPTVNCAHCSAHFVWIKSDKWMVFRPTKSALVHRTFKETDVFVVDPGFSLIDLNVLDRFGIYFNHSPSDEEVRLQLMAREL